MGWFSDIFAAGTGIASFIQGKQNLAFQKENLAFQRQLQQKIFDREDSAVSRRAADLENAGLSKTLAAGEGAGAGSVVATTAPQDDSMARLVQSLNVRQMMANVKKTEQETVNEVKRGAVLDHDVYTAQEQQAYYRAQTALATGQLDMLGTQKEQIEASIAEAMARTEKIIQEMGLFDLQKSGIELDNLGKAYANQGKVKNNVLLDYEKQKAAIWNDIYTAQLAGVILDNEIKGLDYQYQNATGLKPGTGGQFGEIAGGIGTMAGNLFDVGKNFVDKLLSKYR